MKTEVIKTKQGYFSIKNIPTQNAIINTNGFI